MGHRSLRRHYGGGYGRWWLANHSHPRPQDGETATGSRLRRRDDGRRDYSSSEPLGYSALNDSRHLHVDHGRRRRETLQRRKVDRSRANHLGVASDSAGYGLDRLSPGTASAVVELIGKKIRRRLKYRNPPPRRSPFKAETGSSKIETDSND